jgi:hypothetical protein
VNFPEDKLESEAVLMTDAFPREARKPETRLNGGLNFKEDFPCLVDFYLATHVPQLVKLGGDVAILLLGDEAWSLFGTMCTKLAKAGEIKSMSDWVTHKLPNKRPVKFQWQVITFTSSSPLSQM